MGDYEKPGVTDANACRECGGARRGNGLVVGWMRRPVLLLAGNDVVSPLQRNWNRTGAAPMTDDRNSEAMNDLVQRLTASMVPHPMYASGWNACLDACAPEIERMRAEVAAIAYERDGLLQAYSDEKVRADTAESELAALRKRVALCQCLEE